MTRAEKVVEAQRLRAEGLLLREIAERMGAAIQTVHAWLSDPDGSRLRTRKASYGGTCELCGGPTDGTTPGRGPAARVCGPCHEWPEEAIIDAIRRWAEEHGGIPPTSAEWCRSGTDHPSSKTVGRRLGWNEALLRAGFQLRCDRRPETQEWIEARARAGVPTQEIADALGISADAIHKRFYWRGKSINDFRRFGFSPPIPIEQSEITASPSRAHPTSPRPAPLPLTAAVHGGPR